MSTMHDLIVIGGGINGATTALFAARGGMDVAVIDRGPLCREASGVNAGTLTMQMTRVALIPYALRAHHMWANAIQSRLREGFWRACGGVDGGIQGQQVMLGLGVVFNGSRHHLRTRELRQFGGASLQINGLTHELKRLLRFVGCGLSHI